MTGVIKARVTVTLKNGVLDPQGKAIEHALDGLGFAGIGSVRQGKVFDIEIDSTDRARTEADLKAMCDRLLANTVIENYSVAMDRGADENLRQGPGDGLADRYGNPGCRPRRHPRGLFIWRLPALRSHRGAHAGDA